MSLLDLIAATIAPGTPVDTGTGMAMIQEDSLRINSLLEGNENASSLRLWTNSQCLVTTRRFAKMPGFEEAALASAARGWPVFVRSSGGTTVAHRPGMLNISLVESWLHGERDFANQFQCFCDDLAHSICIAGFEAYLGWVPASHCDGRFNIAVKGKKIAGTACLVRRRGARVAMLSHATIWIDGDLKADVDAIRRFEYALGFRAEYSLDVHANLEQFQYLRRHPGSRSDGLDVTRPGNPAMLSPRSMLDAGAGKDAEWCAAARFVRHR